MKFNKSIYFSAVFLSFILFCGYSTGPGNRGLALTGAPGENGTTCSRSGCHLGNNAFNQETTIEVRDADGNLVSEYLPGELYDVTVKIEAASGTPRGYGFQLASMVDATSMSTNSWSEIPSGFREVTLLDDDRKYVEHQGTKTANSFTVAWTAPAEGSGSVTFYAAGNAVDRNGRPSGDSVDQGSTQIAEGVISSNHEVSTVADLKIYPNPTLGVVNFELPNDFRGFYTVRNIIGKTVASGPIDHAINSLDLTDKNPGIYLLSILDKQQNRVVTRRVIRK